MVLQKSSIDELKNRAFENLELVAEQYVKLYGKNDCIEQSEENLCKYIVGDKNPKAGWVRFATLSGSADD